MRSLDDIKKIKEFKITQESADGVKGYILRPYKAEEFFVNVFWSEGWDCVSAFLKNRSPTSAEMRRVKDLFFKESEAAVQFFSPESVNVFFDPYRLSLWREQEAGCVLPSEILLKGNR